MSQYLPVVAWSTIASNVTLGASAYRYYITVNPLDPNEPGASPMTVAINDWFIDFAGYPFLIENVAGSVLTVYDILERGDGVISAYAPYANKLGYVYRPLNGAIILTQAQLRKLDASAADIITPIEKGIIWKYRGIEIDALYGDSEVIETIAQESVDNITKLSLSPEFILRAEEDGWRGGKKYSLSLDGLLHNNLQGVQGTGLDDDYIHLDQDQIDALWTKDGLNITRDSAASLTGILSVDEIKSHTDALPLIKKDGNNVRFSTCILSDCVNDRVGIFTETPLYTVDINGTVRIGTLTGLIKGTTGVLSTATAGTDYENPLTFQHSLTRNINTINLVGDSSAPGNSKYYGTNSSGTRGYYDLPSSGGTPGGSDTYVQFNDGGSFGGDSGLTFNKTTDALTCAGVITGSNIETNATSLSTRLGIDSGKNEDESTARRNVYIGYQSGYTGTTGPNDCVSVGYQAGYNNTGDYNTNLGAQAGYTNSSGQSNTFVGYQAGYSSTANYNTFIGRASGQASGSGKSNTCVGYASGQYIGTSESNVCIGAGAGQYLGNETRGDGNVFLGEGAGQGREGGNYNIFIGNNSGASPFPESNPIGNSNVGIGVNSQLSVNSGTLNVSLGANTLWGIITGSNNTSIGSYSGTGGDISGGVFLGYCAGKYETGSNKLFIDNQDRGNEATARTNSLVHGEFNATVSSQWLRVNGILQIPDGLTAPATVSGYALIYVDSADGDLKIKFGDGTVKTIVTDT